MFDLSGKKALVTGSSGGIGEAVARAMHARGAIVGLHGTREEKLNELASELGERCSVFPANLSDLDAVDTLGKKVEEEMGGVTYSTQYTTDSKDTLNLYYLEDAPALQEEGQKLFGDKMLTFRTELQVVSEH